MIKLIPLLLLTSCSLTSEHDEYLNRIDSVVIGDSYRLVLAKVVNKPFNANCRRPVNKKMCSVVYDVSAYNKVVFTFNTDKKLTNIYL
jgi:hypothetical protein